MVVLPRHDDILDESSSRTLATFSPALANAPYTRTLFGVQRVMLKPLSLFAGLVDFVVGWGEKPTARPAKEFAQRHDLAYLRAEDGFVRSVGLGVLGAPACSIVLDDLGIYYDATSESRLERWLNDPCFYVGAAERERAMCCIERIVSARLSKYNHAHALPQRDGNRRRVLVVDQTRGDMSIALGLAPRTAFDDMLRAALAEHPNAQVLVKSHPDVISGKKAGNLTSVRDEGRIVTVREAVNPIALLETVDHVYVATSQLGFEALMLGKKVSCFGVPFYAGWGLTDDRVPVPRRRTPRTVPEVFAAAYFHYARYVNPISGKRCQLEGLVDAIARLQADPTFALPQVEPGAAGSRPRHSHEGALWHALVETFRPLRTVGGRLRQHG
jgi:capsular polysaccharide export protein